MKKIHLILLSLPSGLFGLFFLTSVLFSSAGTSTTIIEDKWEVSNPGDPISYNILPAGSRTETTSKKFYDMARKGDTLKISHGPLWSPFTELILVRLNEEIAVDQHIDFYFILPLIISLLCAAPLIMSLSFKDSVSFTDQKVRSIILISVGFLVLVTICIGVSLLIVSSQWGFITIAAAGAVLSIICRYIVREYKKEKVGWREVPKNIQTEPLRHQGLKVHVLYRFLRGCSYGKSENPITHFTIETALNMDKSFRLHVYKKSFITFIFVKNFGARLIRLGNPEFDARYAIAASHEQFIQQILTVDIQRKLLRLASRFTPRLYVADKIASFAILNKRPRDSQTYDEIVNAALDIFGRLKETCSKPGFEVDYELQNSLSTRKELSSTFKIGLISSLVVIISLVVICGIVAFIFI